MLTLAIHGILGICNTMTDELTVPDSQELTETSKSKKSTLTIERAQGLLDRVLQRRLRLVDRYNGISIPGVREARTTKDGAKGYDGHVAPGDPPGIQMIFHLGKMLIEAGEIEDPYNRINAQSGITKQLAALCDRFEDQSSKIVQEVQKFIEMEEGRGMPTDEELAKIAQLVDVK